MLDMKRFTALVIGLTFLVFCANCAVHQEIEDVMQRYMRAALTNDGSFEIKGDRAVLNLTYRGEPVKGHFVFKKEVDGWRLDAVDQFQMISERVREAFAASGLGETTFIERTVANTIGKPFKPDWWNP